MSSIRVTKISLSIKLKLNLHSSALETESRAWVSSSLLETESSAWVSSSLLEKLDQVLGCETIWASEYTSPCQLARHKIKVIGYLNSG